MDKTKSEIINKYNKKFYNKTIININSNFKILSIKDFNPEEHYSQGLYLIDNTTSKTVGYNILETAQLSNQVLNLAKGLSLNNSYLVNEIVQQTNITVKFYEKFHSENKYIERYAITTDKWGFEELVMDSFYPSSLEKTFKPYILDNINKKLDFWNRYWNGQTPD